MSKKIVVIMAHQNLNESVLNKRIKEELQDEDNVVYKDLTSLYGDFNIDIKQEHEDLKSASKIIFQFPLYWYTIPSLLKKYVDDVFSYGFAYELNDGVFMALALKDKEFQMIVTIGAKKESYEGEGRLSVEECLNSSSYTAKLLGMKELDMFKIHGASFNEHTNNMNNIMCDMKKAVL